MAAPTADADMGFWPVKMRLSLHTLDDQAAAATNVAPRADRTCMRNETKGGGDNWRHVRARLVASCSKPLMLGQDGHVAHSGLFLVSESGHALAVDLKQDEGKNAREVGE
jgi:hypothetical protein